MLKGQPTGAAALPEAVSVFPVPPVVEGSIITTFSGSETGVGSIIDSGMGVGVGDGVGESVGSGVETGVGSGVGSGAGVTS